MDMKIEEILPEPFEWCQIPAGSTIIIDENLSALGREEVGAFSISKYPITNAQYKVFIDASDGYTNELWWNFSKNAIRWRIDNSNARESAFQGEDQPRTNVTWYEAIAFCRWLARKTGRPIQLPTEQQWQRAAQGDDDRIYPWGNDFDKSFCNFKSFLRLN